MTITRRLAPTPARNALFPAAAGRNAFLLFLALVLVSSGCGAQAPKRSQRVPVLVAQAERRTVPYEIEASGTVEPIQTASVTSQVQGIVTHVLFQEGSEVRAGQPLFQLDPAMMQAAHAQATAMLAKDRAQTETARLALVRGEKLAEQKLIADGELDQLRSNYQALAASVRADSAAAMAARLNVEYATIRAPIGGKTGSLNIHVGDQVKANEPASPLVSINQIRPIRVRFTLPEDKLADVRQRVGHDVRVEAQTTSGDSLWAQGKLAFVDNGVDPSSGTVLLKGQFTNQDGRLWPGQFVRVRVRLYDQGNATIVPSTAVTSSQSGTYLFVVKADTTVEARPIRVQRTWGDYSVIEHGVNPGETVVTDGQLRLSPGAKALIRKPGGGTAADGGKT
jgi:multidrug efflux system membrane fusion protein